MFTFRLTILAIGLMGGLLMADDFRNNGTRTRLGAHVSRFRGGTTDSGTQGLMVGFRHSWYVFDGLNIGLEANAGAPTDGAIVDNNLLYAGMILGFDKTFLGIFYYDLSVTVGYGWGRSNAINEVGQSAIVHPQAGLGLVVVDGYRVSFSPGYLYAPGAQGFSNITFGLRFERKTESMGSRPVNQ